MADQEQGQGLGASSGGAESKEPGDDLILNKTYSLDEENGNVMIRGIPATYYVQETMQLYLKYQAQPSKDKAAAFNGFRKVALEKLQEITDLSLARIAGNQDIPAHGKIISIISGLIKTLSDLPATADVVQAEDAGGARNRPTVVPVVEDNFISPKSLELVQFSGDVKVDKVDAKQYVRMVDLAAEAGRWSTATTLLQVQRSLKGQALSWFDYCQRCQPDTFASWPAFKQALIKSFSSEEAEVDSRMKVFKIRQNNENPMRTMESVCLAAYDFFEPYKDAASVDEVVQKGAQDLARVCYLLALDQDIRKEIYRQNKAQAPIAEMQTLASSIWLARGKGSTTSGATTKAKPPGPEVRTPRPEIVKIDQRKTADPKITIINHNEASKAPRKCTHCGQMGHLRSYCWQLNKDHRPPSGTEGKGDKDTKKSNPGPNQPAKGKCQASRQLSDPRSHN